MHPVVEARRAEIEALCRKLGVRRLDAFGSVVGDDFDVERSDIDVLVDIDPTTPGASLAGYFRLKDGLEHILGRSVDVIDVNAMENPYFRADVLATRELLYAA